MKDHWKEGPKGKYHRRCYQVYTDSKKVSRVETQIQNVDYTEDQSSSEPLFKTPCSHLPKNKVKSFQHGQALI